MSVLQHRKPRPLDRRIAFRDAMLIIIATEGQKTEKQYFDIFRNQKIQVKIIETRNGRSSPVDVLKRLDVYQKEYDIAKEDQLWLMTDTDRWGNKILSSIVQEAKQKGYKLAISNPCFECWLLLHFEDITENNITCGKIKKRLQKIMGSYDSSNLRTDQFTMSRIENAACRAEKMDKDRREPWPHKVGTHVYKVVKSIMKYINK